MGQEMPESIRMIDQHCEIAITLPWKAKPEAGEQGFDFWEGNGLGGRFIG
jgi:hypothetical protein